MAEMRRFGVVDLLVLLLVLGVAGGLRAGYLLACADGSKSSGPLRVQDARPPLVDFEAPEDMRGGPRPDEMDALIHNVHRHRWFGSLAPYANSEELTAHVAPGYPWLVGYLAQVVPDNRLDSIVRWIQMGLGTLTAGLYFLFARRAFRSLLVGMLAGLFTAANPFWIVSTASLDDVTLASFALAGCLFLASQVGEKGGALGSLLLGLALGGVALVRAAFLPFAFVGLIWFLLRSRTLASSWLCGLLSFLGFVIALAPWTVRNYQVFKEPVAVVTSTYLHLWIGNNPEATGGPATASMMESALSQVADEEDEKARNDAVLAWRNMPQPARYARLGKLVAKEVREQPIPTMQRRLRATIAFFLGDRWLTEGTLADWSEREGETAPPWLKRAYPGTLHGVVLGMLFLAFLGWRWSYGLRWESVPAALAMIWIPLPYILSHAEGLSGARMPLDGVLLCFAAFGLVGLIPGLNGKLLDPPDAGPTPPPQQQTRI